jgi:S1 RNA binding domain
VIFMSWQDFLARHQVGDVIEGVVTDQVPFGSFVESEGVTGLAPGQSWPAGVIKTHTAAPGETDSPGAAP